jgi:predicted nucleic acid-binding protein
MEQIWRRYPPGSGRIKTQQHLSDIGVDVNDVWIAAVALEHNLTLLTVDQMQAIRTCMPSIRFDNWLE